MSEASANGTHIDASKDEFSRRVVTQLMQTCTYAHPCDHSVVPLGHRAGHQECASIDCTREYEGILGQMDTERGRTRPAALTMFDKNRCRIRVKHDIPLLMILRIGFGPTIVLVETDCSTNPRGLMFRDKIQV
jgi:hypothetical protein